MARRNLIIGVAFAVIIAAMGETHTVARFEAGASSRRGTWQDSQGVRFNELFAKSPQECQHGTASLELVKAWLAREVSYLPGSPTWVLKEQDLDFDGTPDILISDPRLSGTGGQSYWAFVRTPRGLRYIGGFLGSIRALPSRPGRVIIATSSGSGAADLYLAEIRPDGLNRLASAMLAAGDSGSDEGNRLYNELMHATDVSDETLRRVFGQIGEHTG